MGKFAKLAAGPRQWGGARATPTAAGNQKAKQVEAYRIDRFGSVDGIVLRSSEDPRPGLREILMRVHAFRARCCLWATSLGRAARSPPCCVNRELCGCCGGSCCGRAVQKPAKSMLLRLHREDLKRNLVRSEPRCGPLFDTASVAPGIAICVNEFDAHQSTGELVAYRSLLGTYSSDDRRSLDQLLRKRIPDHRPDTRASLIATLLPSLGLWAGICGATISLASVVLR
jgi:hypothetical protein